MTLLETTTSEIHIVGLKQLAYLGIRIKHVDKTKYRYKRNTHNPHKGFPSHRHGLHETHLWTKPDVGEVLLAIRMSHELK